MPARDELFADEPEDTRVAIMRATYDALSKHGYADLTIQRIGDEFDKSKSLLYHHYDSKDDLLVDFLGFMLKRMEGKFPINEDDTADKQLRDGFGYFFDTILTEDATAFNQALVELRSQAATDEQFREQFTKNDSYFRERLVEVIRTGVEQDVFRDVDPEQAAAFLYTTLQGAMFRHSTADGDLTPVREELDQYVRTRLLTED